MRHVIAGTAGHIDHGKSALIMALTGTDPDRLKEEKIRGITIDLGFAHLDLGEVQVGFIDVPGHEKFVKNMLAGIGGIDFVLMVIAADESIMPQTREHFDICRLLEIKRGLVIITKIDLVDPEMVDLVRDEISQDVRGSFLETSEIIPVSSRTGAGIAEVKQAIHRLALGSPERPSDSLLRLPIDRAFSMRGFGTVVTGTLMSGRIGRDEEVEILPAKRIARVRGIQVHGAAGDSAMAGQRTAVNLQGVDLAEVERGMVLAPPHTFQPARMLDVRLALLPSAPHPLKNLLKVRFHQGTIEVLARVALLGREILNPGETGYAQLRLDKPVFCLHGDAFILRQFSPTLTIGGGRILNPQPTKHKTTERSVLTQLQQLDRESIAEKVRALLSEQGGQPMDLRQLNALFGLDPARFVEVCADLATEGHVRSIPAKIPILILPSTAEILESETILQVQRFHEQNPLLRGIPKEELRTRLFGSLPVEVFRYCLDGLVARKKVTQEDELVFIFGREVELSGRGSELSGMIEEIIRASRYQAPILTEIIAAIGGNAAEIRKIYFWMIKEKLLVKINEDLVYHTRTLDEIKLRIRERYSAGAKFGVAEFKDLFNLTRKHAIPLLEFLDREHFTRRSGNERILL